MAVPSYLQPFVLPLPEHPRRREGTIDIYSPGPGPHPVVVLVHGGPVPPDIPVAPRDWPMFAGYGALLAGQGLLAVTVDHRLHSPAGYADAAADVAEAVQRARALPEADPERVALWFFSGGGLLAADWLREPPRWLRCLALTYPLLARPEGWGVDPRFSPVDAVADAGELPVLLTRAGREAPEFAAGVAAFTEAAERHGIGVEVIDVPNGQHSFDILDHTDESRTAVERAALWVGESLRR
ncbi:alpha/beta hydrolase [Nocardia asteroides]|uniref:alpha/beta hydrolase n=1 Tax=Nocardia asteroides TaxID=1824 RepID=UPI001E438DD6|nr:alpha/beta hydrolase [Nocardia asteroides]UGT62698.1 alpha/beta hydrolase [Nocardia asteroides]